MREFHNLANPSGRCGGHRNDELFDVQFRLEFRNPFRRSDDRDPVNARVPSAIIIEKRYWLETQGRLVHRVPCDQCTSFASSNNAHPARFAPGRLTGQVSERPRAPKAESDGRKCHDAEYEIDWNDSAWRSRGKDANNGHRGKRDGAKRARYDQALQVRLSEVSQPPIELMERKQNDKLRADG